jgi:hypothetical protein
VTTPELNRRRVRRFLRVLASQTPLPLAIWFEANAERIRVEWKIIAGGVRPAWLVVHADPMIADELQAMLRSQFGSSGREGPSSSTFVLASYWQR